MHVFLMFFAWPDGGIWGNVMAMPACGVVAGVTAFIFKDHIGRALGTWYRRHFGMHADLAEIRDLAARAHRIAADTHRHVTGKHHPDAPEVRNETSPETPPP